MTLAEALRHPVVAGGKIVRRLNAVMEESGWLDDRFWDGLRSRLGPAAEEVRRAAEEARPLTSRVRAEVAAVGPGWPRTGCLELSAAEILYGMIRVLRPKVAVETGIANGTSSYLMLEALRRNGEGALWSLEKEGPCEFIAPGREIGWLVPPDLRERWTIVRGSSPGVLEARLGGLPPLDFFMHDSLHSYELMQAEFHWAWPRLRPGGWLASDDVSLTEAVADFGKETGSGPLIWRNRIGFLRRA